MAYVASFILSICVLLLIWSIILGRKKLKKLGKETKCAMCICGGDETALKSLELYLLLLNFEPIYKDVHSKKKDQISCFSAYLKVGGVQI